MDDLNETSDEEEMKVDAVEVEATDQEEGLALFRSKNKTGYQGVYKHHSGKYRGKGPKNAAREDMLGAHWAISTPQGSGHCVRKAHAKSAQQACWGR